MSDVLLGRAERLISEFREFAKHDDPKEVATGSWMANFGNWLLTEYGPDDSHHDGDEETVIGVMAVLLHNSVRSRFNRVINDTPMANIMDYHFLALLSAHGAQRKSDLIAGSHMEMSSGIEVVRRLLKKSWISERPHPSDRRSKLVEITETGIFEMEKMQPLVEDEYRSMCSALGKDQKKQLIKLLELLLR